jgi:hypothetical protein
MSRIKGRIAAAESKAGICRQDNRIDLFFVEGWLPCIARHGDASRCDDGNVRDHRSAPALFSQDRGAELWCRRTWRARQPCGQFLGLALKQLLDGQRGLRSRAFGLTGWVPRPAFADLSALYPACIFRRHPPSFMLSSGVMPRAARIASRLILSTAPFWRPPDFGNPLGFPRAGAIFKPFLFENHLQYVSARVVRSMTGNAMRCLIHCTRQICSPEPPSQGSKGVRSGEYVQSRHFQNLRTFFKSLYSKRSRLPGPFDRRRLDCLSDAPESSPDVLRLAALKLGAFL